MPVRADKLTVSKKETVAEGRFAIASLVLIKLMKWLIVVSIISLPSDKKYEEYAKQLKNDVICGNIYTEDLQSGLPKRLLNLLKCPKQWHSHDECLAGRPTTNH